MFHGTDPDAYLSNGLTAVLPDSHSFRSGQTTLVDAGGAGWRNFGQFKANIIDTSKTRVLSFINIVGSGMKGGPAEQDLNDMDARLTAMRILQHKGLIVGIKVAHYNGGDWNPVDRAVEAGTDAEVPVMIDFGGHFPPLSLDDLLNKHLRPGDILTHMYGHVRGRHPIVNEQGQVEPYVIAARKRGVIFDVGHGGGSFLWRQAVPATKQGFFPDVISTDLHTGSENAGMKDILNVMSKIMNLGMPLKDVIAANTARPAAIIKRDDLGHLGVGTEADVAVLAVRKGDFGFIDSSGGRMKGTQKLECEVTIRAGQVVVGSQRPGRAGLVDDAGDTAGQQRAAAPPLAAAEVRRRMMSARLRGVDDGGDWRPADVRRAGLRPASRDSARRRAGRSPVLARRARRQDALHLRPTRPAGDWRHPPRWTRRRGRRWTASAPC